jgi:zinc D-Ala-D-Ala carboxypeptidase
MEDRQLTENFTLYELTRTDRQELQAKNRDVCEDQVDRLRFVAELLEACRTIIGAPLKVHSGYRCLLLNNAVGSSGRSQHLLCEAADFSPLGADLHESFKLLRLAVREGRLPVGQLIFETAERSYGETSWIHISLGAPWRDPERCSQVLRMEHGKYTALA